jgi:uncharacterized protein
LALFSHFLPIPFQEKVIMRWEGRERSKNVEDRRGLSPATMAGGGGLLMLVVMVIAIIFGMDPRQAQQALQQAQQKQGAPANQKGEAPAPDDKTREFIEVVLRDTETVWEKVFSEELGVRYIHPELVIFSGAVNTNGCGSATRDVGPFYCPKDRTVYIDPSFFDQLAKRHNAPGDFAQAYVIGHEVAHHVQNLTGFMDRVDEVRAQGDTIATNKATVRLELQADYLAGVWAHHAHKEYGILEEGDMEEAITAAYQIGDDTLMKEAGMAVDHRRFTHGTSKQRVYWFTQGLRSGDIAGCKELFEVDERQLDPKNRN